MKSENFNLEWSNEKSRIINFLTQVESSFYEPLSHRVNLSEYATKLSEKARNIFLTAGKKDIAHLAFYEDDFEKKIFLSSISIQKSSRGMGIGSYFLAILKIYARENNFRTITLEVDYRASNLVAFYEKNEFHRHHVNGNRLFLVTKLN
jgi:GNAT superfamily N-acetyltransferase